MKAPRYALQYRSYVLGVATSRSFSFPFISGKRNDLPSPQTTFLTCLPSIRKMIYFKILIIDNKINVMIRLVVLRSVKVANLK